MLGITLSALNDIILCQKRTSLPNNIQSDVDFIVTMSYNSGMKDNIITSWTRGSNEATRDFPSYFHAEKYESIGYKPHLHRNLEIYCVIKGSSHITINDREYNLTEGQGVVINSMQIHSYQNSEGTVVSFLLVGTKFLQLFNSVYPERVLPESLFNSEANKPILQLINDITEKYDDFDVFEAMGYSNLLIHYIVKAYGTESAKKGSKKFIFSEIIQYIYDHYTEDLSLASLSEQFNYAPRSLGHLFSKYVRMDIRNFINSVRVEKVIEMKDNPENSNKTILDLAVECGFNSASSFYRAYRKNYK